ncbi:DUF3472 domain-containing protein [Sphingobacterium sp. SRCM116780]|uniref:DUF3472 domain-containing protein n=1 Tax=Sphingobacterium sp. SRCM116780 TaxID=2907623 RepID=UPI001F1CBAC6|nr:DUF3472 domain-containing protein [Sphingobacterium sp. SRCM116780]UIR55183.1 DUF3472 domain-containing protein [Sphingobacterium sp. SRCM116780]
MESIKKLLFLFLFLNLTIVYGQSSTELELGENFVPIGGNSWEYPQANYRKSILKTGKIENWKSPEQSIKTFMRFGKTGNLNVAVHVIAANEGGKFTFTLAGKSVNVVVDANQKGKINISNFSIPDTGYYAIEIKANTIQALYPTIDGYIISGDASDGKMNYVKNNDDNFFYWGRRGPSTHMGYQQPTDKKIEYYYNEVTVPKGSDIEGSYFMSNGFNVGYFGMQVNSSTERRILFSVWSPFTTDNPKEIPDDHKIILKTKGETVHTGEFGNEGSGGQSFLKFNWVAGNTYKFLLRGRPIGNNYTAYTAWFYAPEIGKWQIIAEFHRPQTDQYLTGFHSFLENFNPDQGIYERQVQFANQWVADNQGNWYECTQGRFTVDNTGKKGYRMDYSGGVNEKGFYLKNFGFFKEYVPAGSKFIRKANGIKPKINFKSLPQK